MNSSHGSHALASIDAFVAESAPKVARFLTLPLSAAHSITCSSMTHEGHARTRAHTHTHTHTHTESAHTHAYMPRMCAFQIPETPGLAVMSATQALHWHLH